MRDGTSGTSSTVTTDRKTGNLTPRRCWCRLESARQIGRDQTRPTRRGDVVTGPTPQPAGPFPPHPGNPPSPDRPPGAIVSPPPTGGPSGPPAMSPPPLAVGRGAGRWSVLAFGLAALAMAVALVATLVAGRTTTGPDNGPAAAPATTAATAKPADQPGPTPTSGQINPSADFTVVYQQQELQLQSGSSCGTVYIDLDEPRVGVRENYDLTFYDCSNQAYFQLADHVVGSSVSSPTATPKDCAEKIRTAPLAEDQRVPPTNRVVLCIATSLADAVKQGITQKMAVLQVRAVGTDGTVNVLVSAWSIPR